MAYFKSKNLCDKTLKIKKLNWQFCCIFHWLRHGILRFFWRCYLDWEICKTNLPILRFFWDFLKMTKTPTLWCKLHPLECISKISFSFYLVAFSVGYIVVYFNFSVAAVFVEQFTKQNFLFSDFFTENLSSPKESSLIIFGKNSENSQSCFANCSRKTAATEKLKYTTT